MLGKGIREVRLIYTFLLAAFLMAQSGLAQSTPDQKTDTPDKPAAPDNTAKAKKTLKADKTSDAEKTKGSSGSAESPGPTAFVQASGNHSNMFTVLEYDIDIGYKWNSHVSTDIGLPLISVRSPFSPISTVDWRDTTIFGTPYLDIRYDTKHNGTNITSILTGAAGMNMVKTFSNGRMTVDWFNHLDRNYQILSYDIMFSPFLNFGAGTGSVDRQVMPRPYELARPYETLGFLGNGEVGGAFTIKKVYRLEGSAYGLSPMGPQKVYSRIVAPDFLLGGDGHHNRYWDAFFETGGELVNTYNGGPSRIARDNGFGGYLEISRFKNVTVELGYTKSVRYDYGSAFIMLRYNLTGLLRSLTVGE